MKSKLESKKNLIKLYYCRITKVLKKLSNLILKRKIFPTNLDYPPVLTGLVTKIFSHNTFNNLSASGIIIGNNEHLVCQIKMKLKSSPNNQFTYFITNQRYVQ